MIAQKATQLSQPTLDNTFEHYALTGARESSKLSRRECPHAELLNLHDGSRDGSYVVGP